MDNFFHLIKPTIWANMRENKPPTWRSFSRARFQQNEQTQSENLREKETSKAFFLSDYFICTEMISCCWFNEHEANERVEKRAMRAGLKEIFRESFFFWWIKTSMSLISLTCEGYPSESEETRMLSIQSLHWLRGFSREREGKWKIFTLLIVGGKTRKSLIIFRREMGKFNGSITIKMKFMDQQLFGFEILWNYFWKCQFRF